MLWRVTTCTLPTKDLLLSRRINVCSICPVCNIIDESTLHVLVNCEFAKLCWEQMGFLTADHVSLSFVEWFTEKMQTHSTKEVKNLSMVCWSLWKNQNNIVWNQKSSEVENSAILVHSQWQSAYDGSFYTSLSFITPSDDKEH